VDESQRASVERASGPKTFRVSLEPDEGGLLGIAFRAEPCGLIITGIVDNSPADAWNLRADSERALCVGDIITAVNGVTPSNAPDAATRSMAMAEEIMNAVDGVCCLTVRAFGPRWHLRGVTALCIDKLQVAKRQGMDFEGTYSRRERIGKEAERHTATRTGAALVFVAAALPSAVALAVCSSIGSGIVFFEMFADPWWDMAGNAIFFAASFIAVGMYVVDWHKWQSKSQQVSMAIFVVYLFALGGVVKCRQYPQVPLIIFLVHTPLCLGVLRIAGLRQVTRTSFYRVAGACTLLLGVAVFMVWLVWMNAAVSGHVHRWNDETKARLAEASESLYVDLKVTAGDRTRSLDYRWDCEDQEPTDFDLDFGTKVDSGIQLSADELKLRSGACAQVNTILFLLWVAPFVIAVANLAISAFCFINSTVSQDNSSVTQVEKTLTQFTFMLTVVALCMWVATSIAGASMRFTGVIMGFCGSALIALFAWACMEVNANAVAETMRKSRVMQQLVFVVTNDWFRACFLLGPGVLLPFLFVVEFVKQQVRFLRRNTAIRALLTPEARSALEYFMGWRWVIIFVRANWLVLLYWTLSVGVAKVTVIFLAWLNEEFEESIPFAWVIFIFFWIGLAMFMLPPVPGIPVYITAGIIIAGQGRSIPSIGFGGGIIIAIALSFVLKLCAVCGQYAIGYFLGQYVKVQQLVGVDKVPIRAVESILLKRGLGLDKVSVLVGGPDWPTSVLCGILRLSLFQCCLGTTPVIVVSSPCVVAGAFLAGPRAQMTDSEKRLWDTWASTALAVSAFGQLASGVVAMYFIQDTIGRHASTLSAKRPEHEAVRQLTLSEQHIRQCYEEVFDWRRLPRFWLRFIACATIMMIGCFFIFMMMDELCFRSFQVKDKISDPEGLNCPHDFGCALVNLVQPPLGWVVLSIFSLATIMHLIFLRHASIQATKRYQWKRMSGLLEPASSFRTIKTLSHRSSGGSARLSCTGTARSMGTLRSTTISNDTPGASQETRSVSVGADEFLGAGGARDVVL